MAFVGGTLWSVRYTRTVYTPAATEALSAWQLFALLKLSTPVTWPEMANDEATALCLGFFVEA